MQYLKEETEKKILQVALQEFLDKGFSDASMRNIATNAGVSLGNIYRYFQSKEQLFNALVEMPYSIVMNMDNLEALDGTAIDSLESAVNFIMTNLLKEYRIQFLILMDKSNGTVFESAKNEIIQAAKEKMRKNVLPALEKKGVQVEDDYIFYVMVATFMEGFLIILRQYDDENTIKYLIRQLLYIYFYDCENRFL